MKESGKMNLCLISFCTSHKNEQNFAKTKKFITKMISKNFERRHEQTKSKKRRKKRETT